MGMFAAVTTFVGGRFALRWRARQQWLLCFSAGAVLGVALFDLFPEALELYPGRNGFATCLAIAFTGLLIYGALYKMMPAHPDDWDPRPGTFNGLVESPQYNRAAITNTRNLFGAGGLAIHSLLDGIGIGVAFKVSFSVGVIAAVGVLVHDFSDGINTVGVVLRNNGSDLQARRWLAIDCAAPLVGVLLTGMLSLSSTCTGMLMALFSGFFFYIGAFDLLPEGFRRNTLARASCLTALGAAILYLAVMLAKR